MSALRCNDATRRTIKKEGFVIEQFETWHNEENAKKLSEYDKGFCGGVPFFINTESGK